MMRRANGWPRWVARVMLGLVLALGLSACAVRDDADASYADASYVDAATSGTTTNPVTSPPMQTQNTPGDTFTPGQINPDSPYWDDIFASDGMLVFNDPYFVEWIQAVHMNAPLFIGRTVQFEGFFMSMLWGEDDEVIHSVARFTTACCGLHGFEVYLNDIPQPAEETWVEAIGILEEVYIEEIGFAFLRVNVLELVIQN